MSKSKKAKSAKKSKTAQKQHPSKSIISKASSAASSEAKSSDDRKHKKSEKSSKSHKKSKSKHNKPHSSVVSSTTPSSAASSAAAASSANSAFSGAQTTNMSASMVGTSRKMASSKGAELSTAPGRPMLTKKAKKIMKTTGAIKVKSIKEMEKKHFKMTTSLGKNLYKATAPGDKKAIVKVIDITKISPRYRVNLEKFSIKIMKFIGSKKVSSNFVHIFGVFLMDKSYYIYFEVCDNKSLYNMVVSSKDLPPERIRKWIRQMTEAVVVLQHYGIAHRFLKLKHLLLSKKDNLKISGWTKSVMFWDPSKKKLLLQHKECRARKNNYLPPEAFRNNYDPSKGDVWAIGVTLVNLCTHRYPFHVRAKLKFAKQWRMFVKKHQMNPIVRNLCNKIFVIDLKKRIKARDITKEEYFKVDASQLVNRSTRDKPLKKEKKSKKKTKSKTSKKASKEEVDKEENENATEVSQAELAAEEEDKKADEQQKEEEKTEQEEETGAAEAAGAAGAEPTGEEGGEVGEKGEGEVEKEEEAKEITAPEETADKAEPVEAEPGGEIKDVVDGTAATEVKDAVKDEGGGGEGGEEAATEEGGGEGGEEAAAEGGGEEAAAAEGEGGGGGEAAAEGEAAAAATTEEAAATTDEGHAE